MSDVHALPNRQHLKELAARDDVQAPWFQIFGTDQGPMISHLERGEFYLPNSSPICLAHVDHILTV
jgi:hypothetical protein